MLVLDMTPVPPINISCAQELVAESIADPDILRKPCVRWRLELIRRCPGLPWTQADKLSIFSNMNLDVRPIEIQSNIATLLIAFEIANLPFLLIAPFVQLVVPVKLIAFAVTSLANGTCGPEITRRTKCNGLFRCRGFVSCLDLHFESRAARARLMQGQL